MIVEQSSFQVPAYHHVLPALALFFCAAFAAIPLGTQIHIDQVCKELDYDDCNDSEVSAKASLLNLMTSCAVVIPSLLFCGTYGNIADKYGRKPCIFIPLVGLTVLLFCYMYVTTVNPPSFRLILVGGQFIFGVCGSYTVFLMGVMCYVSDATASKPYTRKMAYSITEAVMFTPQVFAPSIVGVWAQATDFSLPLLTMTCVSAVGILYVWWMPESLSPDSTSRHEKLRYDFFKTVKNLRFLFQYKCQDGSSPLPWLGGAFMLFLVSMFGSNAVFIVYVKHRFDWQSGAIGIYDGIKGLLIVISMIFLTSGYKKVFQSQLRLVTWIQVGLFFRVVFTASLGLVQSSLGIILVTTLTLFTGPVIPYTKTLLSNTVDPLAQAQAFSAISAIESLSGLSGAVFDAMLVGLLRVNKAWLIFEIAAFVVLIAFLMIYYIRLSPSMAQNLPIDTKVESSSFYDSRGASRSMSASASGGGLPCFEAMYEDDEEDGEEESLLRDDERESYRLGSD